MGADRAVTANFASTQRVLSVSRTGTGTGTVTSSPAGINCGPTCSATYADGTGVTLTPAADANSTFAGWSGACTGTGPCSLTMDGDKSVTATFNFVPPPTTVKISQVYGGGGNSGSTYTNDFIELYNPDPLPVPLGGLYLADVAGAPARNPIPALSFIAGRGFTSFIADRHFAQARLCGLEGLDRLDLLETLRHRRVEWLGHRRQRHWMVLQGLIPEDLAFQLGQ